MIFGSPRSTRLDRRTPALHATEVDLRRVSLARQLSMAGPGARVSFSALTGWTIETTPAGKWRHPWFTRLTWLAGLGQWIVTMNPGFVNGRAPVVQTTVVEAKAAAQQDFGINPLSGLPYFSDPIFNQQPQTVATKTSEAVNIPLYYNPLITPAFRNVGFDSFSGEEAPQFFKNLGVQDAPPQPTDDELAAGVLPTLGAAPKAGNRLLRACDLVLHQPRYALTSTVTLLPGIVTGVSNVSQTLELQPADPGDSLKIYAAAKIEDLSQAGIDQLTGDYTEPNFDEILISTVYLLSPANAAPNSTPDASWTPYVRHSQFWNLSYAQPVLGLTLQGAIDAVSQLAAIGSVLAAGSASIAVNFEAASINDAYQAAANILQAQSLEGNFWTPNGGGHDSAFPAPAAMDAPAASGNGLDKNGRSLAQRQQSAQALVTAQLDLEFPYNTSQFNLSLLNLA